MVIIVCIKKLYNIVLLLFPFFIEKMLKDFPIFLFLFLFFGTKNKRKQTKTIKREELYIVEWL